MTKFAQTLYLRECGKQGLSWTVNGSNTFELAGTLFDNRYKKINIIFESEIHLFKVYLREIPA